MRMTMLLAAMLIAGTSAAQDKAPPGSVEKGRKLFVDLACYSCHGTHAQGGGRGAEPPIPLGYPWAGFLGALRKPRQDMPAYEERLVSNQDVADLYAYFVSIKPAPAAKDIPLLRNF